MKRRKRDNSISTSVHEKQRARDREGPGRARGAAPSQEDGPALGGLTHAEPRREQDLEGHAGDPVHHPPREVERREVQAGPTAVPVSRRRGL